MSKTHTDVDYWKERWIKNEIGFHKTELNRVLVTHLDRLTELKQNQKFLFPLCGKEMDIAWLASLGHRVIGIEVVESAIEQFFQEQKIKFNIKTVDDFKVFSSEDERVKIYCGDYFKFTSKYEGLFDCVWDRGALVALPDEIRKSYAPHTLQLLEQDYRYLLATYKYNPDLYPGPPHMVSEEEIKLLYGAKVNVELIDTLDHFSFGPEENETKELAWMLTIAN